MIIYGILKWLQEWYQSQCDGNWEHQYGIDIHTVANPGWYVTINLTDTEWENKPFKHIRYQMENDEDWYFCLTRNNNFEASGSPNHLFTILKIFKEWVES